MKKISLLSLTALLMASGVQAQEEDTRIDTRKLRFGAYVAPTLSWMRPTASKDDKNQFSTENNGSKIGFTWGLMADYNFADNYAFVTGLQLNTTGGKILATNVDQNQTNPSVVRKADFDYRLSFLEIPIALKLRTDDIQGFRFFGQLGITTGFNIGKKATYTVEYRDQDGNIATAEGDNVKLKGTLGVPPVMFQMNIGAGAEYPINKKLAAYAGIFFNNGFAPDATKPDKYDLNYDGTFRDANTRLNNFALRLGLFF